MSGKIKIQKNFCAADIAYTGVECVLMQNNSQARLSQGDALHKRTDFNCARIDHLGLSFIPSITEHFDTAAVAISGKAFAVNTPYMFSAAAMAHRGKKFGLVLASDSFTTSSTKTLAHHTPENGGSWIGDTSDYKVRYDDYCYGISAKKKVAIVTGQTDVIVECKIMHTSSSATYAGVYLYAYRDTADGGYVFAVNASTGKMVIASLSGTLFIVHEEANVGITLNSWKTIKVSADNGYCVFQYDGNELSKQLGPPPSTKDAHGVYSESINARVEDFNIYTNY